MQVMKGLMVCNIHFVTQVLVALQCVVLALAHPIENLSIFEEKHIYCNQKVIRRR